MHPHVFYATIFIFVGGCTLAASWRAGVQRVGGCSTENGVVLPAESQNWSCAARQGKPK